jgi:hypothetical protein
MAGWPATSGSRSALAPAHPKRRGRHGRCLIVYRIVFSEQNLTTNLAALTRAQGATPALAALDPAQARAVPEPVHGLRIELSTAEAGWVPLDGFDPYDAAATALEAFAPDFPAQLVLIGPGLGYALDLLEAARASTKVIVIEPDPGVAVLFLSRRDWSKWFADGRLRLLVGPDYQGATSLARNVSAIEPPPIVVNPVLAERRAAGVERASAIARRIVAEAQSNADARRRFAGRYLLQTIRNLDVIAREGNAAALDGAFQNLPAVVVGAGPSLDENLPALAGYQDRIVIVASDTTLRPLVAAGIRPHIMVGVDPSELNARHLAGVADVGDTWLVAEGSLHSSAFESFAGRTFVFKVSDHEPWPWLRTLGADRGTIRAWGSVATSAFDLTLRMGCNPVIFAGLDLAFTGHRPYCANTIWDDVWREAMVTYGCTWQQLIDDYFSRKPDLQLPDVHGNMVRTASNLVSFRDWLLEQMASRTDRTFVNGTGGGILHGKRLQQADLETILKRLPPLERPVTRTLSALHSSSKGAPDKVLDARAKLVRNPESDVAVRLLEKWVAFTAETVSTTDIGAALAER